MDRSSPERSPRNSANRSTSSSLSYRPSPNQPHPDSPNMDAPIPDDQHGADLPMNMTASVMLTGLPRDAQQALVDVERIDEGKVTVRFQPLPSAPILKNRVFRISASQKFETVVKFLRKKLDCKPTDSVFCYVNSVFAPGLDEGIGGLWRCFKSDDQLIVAYSMTPAFG
ncbi:Autophagy-related protein 12 [Penicillium lividum]|nr:Autophagy-related protein 12 [Penicillium lividum]